LYKETPKLRRSVLSDNKLQDLSWEEFEGLSSLKQQDLFDNQITYLDASKIAKNLPKLKILFTELNYFLVGTGKILEKKSKKNSIGLLKCQRDIPICPSAATKTIKIKKL
jgi:hypothetical protein